MVVCSHELFLWTILFSGRVRVFLTQQTQQKKATEETNYLSNKLQLAVIIKILTNVQYFKIEI